MRRRYYFIRYSALKITIKSQNKQNGETRCEMNKGKRLRKCLLVLTTGSTLIGLALGLDMAVSGSVYHPLTYVYNALSWLGCKNSRSLSCNKTALSVRPVSGKNGIVVTTQHKASEVGLQILKEGGNAVDAAVAVGYALAVTDPCCGNIGGGGFMLIHLANGKNTFINFREKAPLAFLRSQQANYMRDSSTNAVYHQPDFC